MRGSIGCRVTTGGKTVLASEDCKVEQQIKFPDIIVLRGNGPNAPFISIWPEPVGTYGPEGPDRMYEVRVSYDNSREIGVFEHVKRNELCWNSREISVCLTRFKPW